jgi:hypothetical protein
MGGLSLADALALCELLAATDPDASHGREWAANGRREQRTSATGFPHRCNTAGASWGCLCEPTKEPTVRFRTRLSLLVLPAAVVGVSPALACGDPRRFTGASTLDHRDNSGVRYLLGGNFAVGASPDDQGMTLDPVGHDGCSDRVAAMQGRGLVLTDVRSRL